MHPNLDLKNILVSETGELQGLVNWRGACAMPRNLGCESVPRWLRGDWQEHMAYPHAGEQAKCFKYRNFYTDCIQSHLKPNTEEATPVQSPFIFQFPRWGPEKDKPSLTRGSTAAMYLRECGRDVESIPYIVDRFFFEIELALEKHHNFSAADREKAGFYVFFVIDDLEQGKISKKHLELLKKGLDALFELGPIFRCEDKALARRINARRNQKIDIEKWAEYCHVQ
ncbi:uncharacterized protein TRUGW13939_07428 [Talaromyces rugulosus]|uniref:Aminoglycoside phosphotransferase domain-containing protein n=1 Tax=Talaromyces rugulosus TaxID=121627 RepID=A0A7H8R3Q7_TALRU|nr:uncharacterized protein TRUGW13939_07428 [Talaromyces rugulosus]QKX60285.1 hypothetical protein TRUGW13939_07428 [Talaromyces rugulosus]